MMAGLDGIQNKLDPGKPLDKDIYALAPEELKDVPKAPGSLDESLKLWERGEQLHALCLARLNQAEQRVGELLERLGRSEPERG